MKTKKEATKLMNKTTDKAAKALNGVNHQDSGMVTEKFNASIDRASELASAKYNKKNT